MERKTLGTTVPIFMQWFKQYLLDGRFGRAAYV
jgi:hypothetical protein